MIELTTTAERNFEDGTKGRWAHWLDTPVVDSTFAHSGTKSLKWTSTANATGVLIGGMTFTMGTNLYISWAGWTYSSRTQAGVYLYMRHHGTAGYQDVLQIVDTGPYWKPFSGGNQLMAGAFQADFYIYNTAGVTGDNNWMDDFGVTIYAAPKIMRFWDGAAWKPGSPKVWNGTEWI